MGGPKGNQRGNKTHRADQMITRGPSEQPEEAMREPENNEFPSNKQQKASDEHPTGRMKATGKADHRTISPPRGSGQGRS